jgi:myxalamid-type polyketide synthase MxaE and MxaD
MQRAILTIQRMRAKIDSLERARSEPIAIIGMACRFPGGADTPEAFFRLLEEGVDAVTEVPPYRWPLERDGGESADAESRAVRWGAFLRDVDRFDAAYFGVSPREAESLDPQQRLLLEVSWEALERAGQVAERLMGSRTGVFVGIWSLDYQQRVLAMRPEQLDAYCFTGNVISTAAGRLSYVLGLQGPAISVETACSSSLVAIHLACQSLRNGECNMALAGGVNLMLSPTTTRLLSKTQALSPDGRCKTFDARANGFVRGEGCGALVLKRLSDAERDRDPILALLRGSAVNQDGRSTGLTAPNVLSQQALLRQALESARLSPMDIGYVETHGTGTSLGDPIEVDALREVLGGSRHDGSTCVLGAVKTNIGHLEAAAGVAGVIKAVLALEKQRIPPNLHFRTLNPRIKVEGTPFIIPKQTLPWKAGERPRYAGVSSFGISGTNAHVILEEAPASIEEDIAPEASAYLLPLSAKTPEALAALVGSYERWLADPGVVMRLRDAVFTAGARRGHHAHRLAVVGRTREEMAAALGAFTRGEVPADVARGTAPVGPAKVVFVFPGQGSQWLGMGRRLMEEEAVFRTTIEACDSLLAPRLGWSLLDELLASEGSSRLAETEVAQPILFAVEVALAELFKSWGVVPDAVIGHSVGEIAAAHVAKILTLEEACRLVAWRGRIMQKATGRGKMVSVALPEAEAAQAIAGHEGSISIAAVNDPGSVVLAGEAAALDAVIEGLSTRGVQCRPLRVNYAFHSPQMDPFQDALVEVLGAVDARQATLAQYSTMTGECVEGTELSAAYWGRNIRATVRFAAAVDAALRDGYRLFLEVGPHPVLAASVEQCIAAQGVHGAVTYSLRRNHDERRAILAATGALYAHGCAVAWERICPAGRCVPLPTHPFQRERYWIEASLDSVYRPAGARGAAGHPLLGTKLTSSIDPRLHFWEQRLRPDAPSWVGEHVVMRQVVFPGAGYVEMALAAGVELLGDRQFVLKDVSFERMLSLGAGEERTIQLALSEDNPTTWSFRIASREGEAAWVQHAAGTIYADASPRAAASPLPAIQERCRTVMTGEEHYLHMERRGVDVGPSFRGLEQLWLGSGEALGRVGTTDGVAAQRGAYGVPPALLDACFQVLLGLLVEGAPEGTYVPAAIQRVCWRRPLGSQTWVHARLRSIEGPDARVLDLVLLGADGEVSAEFNGFQVHRVNAEAPRMALDDLVFDVVWRQAGGAEPPMEGPVRGRWLLLRDAGGLGAGLALQLRARGAACVEVTAGDRFARLAPSAYQLDPSSPEDFQRLLQEAFDKDDPCAGAIHLWALDATPEEHTTAETLAADQRRSLRGTLYLAQALLRRGWRDTPRLWLFSRGALAVGEDASAVSVSQAPLWGLGRTIALEHPSLECTRVDLDPVRSADEVAHALREILAAGSEDQIAIRSGNRWVARLARGSLGASPVRQAALRADATYLITGGLGGLGLSLSQWMVDNGARYLVLMGRSEPSPGARAALRAMQEAGTQVVVHQGDVARAEDVRAAIARVREQMPQLSGVVHAAGLVEDRTLLELSWEQFEQVLAPKMQGAWNVHVETLAEGLDFFVMYSSAASLLGAPGQANYAAANAFLDALAHARFARGLPGMSIHWGPFSDVGMAAAHDNRARRLSNRGLGSISLEEGLQALRLLLTRPRAEVGLMRLQPRQWMEFYPHAAALPFFVELKKERGTGATAARASSGRLREMLLRMPSAQRLQHLDAHVLEQIAQVLHVAVSRIDRRASFTSLSVDSLMGLELRNRLEASLGVKLAATVLFTYASPAALIAHLATLLQPAADKTPTAVSAPEAAAASRLDEGATVPADDDLLAAFDASVREIEAGKP